MLANCFFQVRVGNQRPNLLREIVTNVHTLFLERLDQAPRSLICGVHLRIANIKQLKFQQVCGNGDIPDGISAQNKISQHIKVCQRNEIANSVCGQIQPGNPFEVGKRGEVLNTVSFKINPT